MFQFIKLVQPDWYFNLSPSKDFGYFPAPDVVNELYPHLKPDPDFSPEASEMELSYRAHRLGCIDRFNRPGMDWWNKNNICLIDEYRFVRKYFHFSRVILVLFYRILMLNNPLKEFMAFFKSGGVKKFQYGKVISEPRDYPDYNSNFFKTQPYVTVIIPTLNRYEYLKDVLIDLENQDYDNFDVIIIDQSNPYQPDFYSSCKLKLKIFRQEQKALWLARNTAIKSTLANYLLFYDDDSRVGPDWVRQHLNCINYYDGDISSGVSISKTGGAVPYNYGFFRWSDQMDTGNVMIKRCVFQKVGLFDRQFERQRMGDGEFGLRSYLAGFKNVSNPLASRIHLKVGEGGLREIGNWDAFRPKSFWSPRPVPSVLYIYRKYFGKKASMLSLVNNIPSSIVPYRLKNNRKALAAGSLVSLLLSPFIIVQVIRSWMKSSEMLKNSRIEKLES